MLRTKAFTCRPFAMSDKDANVMIRTSGQTGIDLADASTPEVEATALVAVQIIRILWMKGSSSRTPAVLLVVRRHQELPVNMKHQDPYRGLGFAVAGCLYRSAHKPFEVITADAIVCPFARTEYSGLSMQVPVAHKDLVHDLPLVRVGRDSARRTPICANNGPRTCIGSPRLTPATRRTKRKY